MAHDGGPSPPDAVQKRSVLIVGGLGYIGRFLAKYLHARDDVATVRIVDKVLPQLAHLAPEFHDACSPATCMQADASRETSMARIFTHPDGPDATWDYVFNLAGETAWSQNPEVYRLRSWQVSHTLAKEAAKSKVKAFVEVSTGMVYAPNRVPRTERDKLKPWHAMAKVKLDAEAALSEIADLNLVILRLPHVYGEYDAKFIAKALCLSRVYQEQGKDLNWLWTADLLINTVHVEDVARALWTAAVWRSAHATVSPPSSPTSRRRLPLPSRGEAAPEVTAPVFNIVDHGRTDQGVLVDVIAQVFGIKTGFQGSIISQFAKLNLDRVVDDLNEDILQRWADMIEVHETVKPGPLNPFLEKELLKDTDLSLDGSLFEETTGFKYHYAEGLTVDRIREMIASYQRMSWWP